MILNKDGAECTGGWNWRKQFIKLEKTLLQDGLACALDCDSERVLLLTFSRINFLAYKIDFYKRIENLMELMNLPSLVQGACASVGHVYHYRALGL